MEIIYKIYEIYFSFPHPQICKIKTMLLLFKTGYSQRHVQHISS